MIVMLPVLDYWFLEWQWEGSLSCFSLESRLDGVDRFLVFWPVLSGPYFTLCVIPRTV